MGILPLPLPTELHSAKASLSGGIAAFLTVSWVMTLDPFDQPFLLSGKMMGGEEKKISLECFPFPQQLQVLFR